MAKESLSGSTSFQCLSVTEKCFCFLLTEILAHNYLLRYMILQVFTEVNIHCRYFGCCTMSKR